MRRFYRKRLMLALLALHCSMFHLPYSTCFAQFNTDRLVVIGRNALYYEDYVLSMQYFNQAISAKPYLYEPWFYRGVAKYYLDDYAGAEKDCTEAIERNPFIVGIYELRGLCRIQQKDYDGAVSDYNTALKYEPESVNFWHNRALCRIQQKNYDQAQAEIDTMLQHWNNNARIYAMQSEVYLLQKDTTKAIASLDKSLEIDAYNGNTWNMRAVICLARQEWQEAEAYLDKAIHLLPRNANLYINRAQARYYQNKLRGAVADYDLALDYEPRHFIGHYNRGLLRAQIGDDNRAITDFDFVLNLEGDNMMALYNRALLLEKTGNPKAAIRDYTKVIEEFPNFWTGLHQRAQCYRKLGMTAQAEQDEFRILKAQLDKRNGIQPRLSKRQMRKRSDEDIEKYNQLAEADEQEMEHEYQNDYRGRVQNRHVGMDYMPMYVLSCENKENGIRQYVAYDRQVDSLNATLPASRQLHIVCLPSYEADKEDLSAVAGRDSTSAVFYWVRATHQPARVLEDLTEAIRLGGNSYLYYNRGNVYAGRQDYVRAIDDYTKALEFDNNLAEAYYNRGLTLIATGREAEGVADLSKAGEQGLYTAYSIIKKYRSQ